MKTNDWQDTIAMAASAIEDLLETADEHAGCWADVPARLRALTAPPAPAVPEEKPKLDYTPSMSWGDQCVAIAEIRGWNACRAAMLAQPVSQGYKLVPVEPTEGMLAAAKEWTGLTETAKVLYREMLAAAPEGGK